MGRLRHCTTMLLVIAALSEELRIAQELCQGCASGVYLVKSGVGPRAAAIRLSRFLENHPVSKILAFGYAGALDPDLKVGDLVAVRRVLSIGENVAARTPLDQMEAEGSWELRPDDLGCLGVGIRCGDVLTTPFIIGDPEQKKLLRARFQTAAVDMETGAFARVASAARIPFAAIRAITDEAEDSFLAPVSYDPASTLAGKAKKVVSAGHWLLRYKDWAARASVARESLRRFLTVYLKQK